MTSRANAAFIPNAGAAATHDCQRATPRNDDAASLRGTRGGVWSRSFWRDRANWIRASKNTLNCLFGCSVGDFGMLFYLQIYHPETPVMIQMALAMMTGLATSVLFESILLKVKEGFAWGEAFKVALSMSFISMLGMELAGNLTDFALTGGKANPSTVWFWVALAIALVVGFLAPLPYNFFKLKKHGTACH